MNMFAALKRKRAASAESDVQVRPIVKHTLSKELQLYYEKITKAVRSKSILLLTCDAYTNDVAANCRHKRKSTHGCAA